MSFDETLPYGGNQFPDERRPPDVMGSGGRAPISATQALGSEPSYGGYGSQQNPGNRTEVMYKTPQVMAWLIIVTDGPHFGKLFPLSPGGTNIGRDAQSDIVLDDGAVSRNHARLKYEEASEEDNQFFIYDLATANGTVVNGEEILKQALYDEDRIDIGRVTLVFKQIDGPVRPTAESESEAEESEPEAAESDSEAAESP